MGNELEKNKDNQDGARSMWEKKLEIAEYKTGEVKRILTW